VSPVGDTFCVPCKYLVVPDGQEDPQTFTSRPAALSSESGERGKSDQNGHHRAPISRKTWWAQGSFGFATMSRVIRIAPVGLRGRFRGWALRYGCPHSHTLLDVAPCCGATQSTSSHRRGDSSARVSRSPTTSRSRASQSDAVCPTSSSPTTRERSPQHQSASSPRIDETLCNCDIVVK
jgi:hypothetical protein